MTRLYAFASGLGDRLNPVAVKEFRQAVQSRWVTSVLMLFLVINLCIIGGYLMMSPHADTSMTGGREVFGSLLIVLFITCIGFVPLYSGVRLSLERSDANVDLLYITTITPGAIVRGKYLAAMALTLLIYSAFMPFLTVTYLLRGIDLPTIFMVLAAGFAVCAVANAMGVFAGCVPGSWLIRGMVDVGMLICLYSLLHITLDLADQYSRFGVRWAGGSEFWTGIATCLLVEVLAIGLLYVLAEALLSPKPSNRMLRPRLYITACWPITGAILITLGCIYDVAYPVLMWAAVAGIGFTVLMVAALGERDAWSARVRRTIPRNPLLRVLAFLFYSGSAGGLIWWTVMFLATMAVVQTWGEMVGSVTGLTDLVAFRTNMSIVFGYVLCYCLTTAVLRMTLLRNIATPNLSVIAGFLGVLLFLVPYLTAFFVSRNWDTVLPWYLLGSPMVLTTTDEAAKDAASWVMMIWILVAVLAGASWAIAQWRRFIPYETAPAIAEVPMRVEAPVVAERVE